MVRGLKRASNSNLGTPQDITKKHRSQPKHKEALGNSSVKDNDEKYLEKLVIGGQEEVLENLNTRSNKKYTGDYDDTAKEIIKRKPVWQDDDDLASSRVTLDKESRFSKIKHSDEDEINTKALVHRLKNQYDKVVGAPNWAQTRTKADTADDEDDSDSDELLRATGNYITNSQVLPKGILDIKKSCDVNKDSPSKGKLKTVEFHRSAQVIMTAGMDQTLRLFQVDGKNNPKIQSVFMEKFPILTAHFTANGQEVIVGSKHKSFYYYDMIAGKVVKIPQIKGIDENCMGHFEISPDGRLIAFLGKYGYIHLISANSKEWIDSLKMNGSVEAVTFSSDATRILSHGDDGDVYVWDTQTRSCVHKFKDEGCIKGTSISVSPNGQYIACGSHSGVVNVYDETCFTSAYPTPLKVIMNLTTSCTNLKFNSTSELLAMASNYSENAVKMVHFPSMAVYSNFPDRTDNMRFPYCLDFSTNSGYFSVGNNKGQALLYRVKHFGGY